MKTNFLHRSLLCRPWLHHSLLHRSLHHHFCLVASLVSSAILLICTSSTAQPTPPATQALAARVDRHYNQLHSLKAGFVESYEGMGTHRVERGTLLLMKPGRMRWSYSEPQGKIFLLNGKFALFYAAGDSQIQRIAASKLDDMRSPLRFLLGHTQLQKELTGLTATPTANGEFILSGKLKGQEKRIAGVRLTVTNSGAITQFEIEEMDGALTRFTLTNEEDNTPIPPESFRFTPPAGVPIVDALPPV